VDRDTAITEPDAPLAREPDRAASVADIAALYAERRQVFVRVARGIVGDASSANDAVQDAFIQALRKRETYRGSGSLEAWLWALVVNAARASARQRSDLPVAQIDDTVAAAVPGDGFDVRAAIAGLPERQRTALFLRYYVDMDYRSIADVLGVTVGTVSATLNHAHEALRAVLDGDRHD